MRDPLVIALKLGNIDGQGCSRLTLTQVKVLRIPEGSTDWLPDVVWDTVVLSVVKEAIDVDEILLQWHPDVGFLCVKLLEASQLFNCKKTCF